MLIDWYAKKSFLRNYNWTKRRRIARCKDTARNMYYDRLYVDWDNRLVYWPHGSDWAITITAQTFRYYNEPVYFESEV